MNKNVLIVLAGAILVAVLVAVLVQVMIGGEDEAPVAVQEAKVKVLVAAKNLSLGDKLGKDDLRWQDWPESAVFPGAVRRQDDQEPSDALEGRLARNVSEGEPMMRSALIGQAKGNFVAANLEPGMRAIAIDVKASSMVAGFIGPGDFVDIILTYKESIRVEDEDPRAKELVERNLEKLATETILQNVKVLAVDQSAVRPEDEELIKVGKTVTLAVNARDAEKLALAAGLGQLDLALRGVGDDAIVLKKWETISDARLTSIGDEVFEAYQELKKDTSINPNIVRIYNGSNMSIVPAK